jgi:CysZ protein
MNQRSGVDYFLSGFSLILTKGLKRFVLIPLIINLLLFSMAFYWLYLQMAQIMVLVESYVPDWLSWITTILLPFLMLAVLVAFSFIFNAAANWIAAPFNGLLAEKVELYLTNQPINPTGQSGFGAIIKDIPRTFSREFCKLKYYIPRALGFLLLLIFLPVIGPVLWFLFTAWMMAVQYCDYHYDNHHVNFDQMRRVLNQSKGPCFSFGMTATLFSLLPVVNLIVMPVAVCGATKMAVERLNQN